MEKIIKKGGEWMRQRQEESKIDKAEIQSELDFLRKRKVEQLAELEKRFQSRIDKLESWLIQINT